MAKDVAEMSMATAFTKVVWRIQVKSTIRLTCTHLSVQHGNIVKHLRNIPMKPKVAEQEYHTVDPDDENDEINPSDSFGFP